MPADRPPARVELAAGEDIAAAISAHALDDVQVLVELHGAGDLDRRAGVVVHPPNRHSAVGLVVAAPDGVVLSAREAAAAEAETFAHVERPRHHAGGDVD